ncbi:TMEM165/GDT1 family protein [Erysipelotrichaceae bacterium HCN-30851]
MFLHTFFFVFFAEMADKTQFMVMALTNRYTFRQVIGGMILGILLISGFSVLAGNLIGEVIPIKWIKLVASIMFLIFGFLNLKQQNQEETGHVLSFKIPLLSIACTFVLAELGDKTQLATVALAADHMHSHFAVFLGASLGLIMANLFGIFAGKILFKFLSEQTMKIGSSFIFFLFGSLTLFETIPGNNTIYVLYSCILILIAYIIYTHSYKQSQ